MSHITLDRSKAWSEILSEFIGEVIAVRNKAHQIRLVSESLSAGGATPANLETPTDSINFSLPSGSGTTVYGNIVSIDSALQGISPTMLADMDQGQ